MKLVSVKTVANAHADGIWAAAWAGAAGPLLTGSADESVKVWSGEELQLERSQGGHSLGVVGLAATPDGQVAAATSLDSVVRIFDVASNDTVATLESKPAEAWQLAFDPRGDMLAVAGGGSGSVAMYRWRESVEPAATVALAAPAAAGGFVLSVAWGGGDGRRLAASSMDGSVAVVDAERGDVVHTLDGHAMPVRSLAFSPAQPRLLFTASDDKHVHVYDAEAGQLVAALSGHAGWVLAVAAAADGAAIATGSSDRSVRLWDLKMRSALHTASEHKDQVWALCFRPAAPSAGGATSPGGRLATVSDDRSICLYDYI